MSMTVAMGRGAQAGVLFRSADALERLEHVDTLVFDKTGTLTRGRPEVVTVLPVEGVPENELMRFAASLEQASEHPLGQAIVRHALARGLRLGRSYGFEAFPGAGAAGVVQLRRVLVGNEALLQSERIDPGSLVTEAAHLREHGQTVVFVAVDGHPIGLISLADPLKDEAWDVVKSLQDLGRARRARLGRPRHLGAGDRGAGRHQGIPRRRRSGRQGGDAAAAAGRRPRGGHGGRRHQRCTGARRGRRRHRDGRRHGRRQAERRPSCW